MCATDDCTTSGNYYGNCVDGSSCSAEYKNGLYNEF